MPIRLGDRNETVRQWRVKMNAWFGPLYTRLIGPLPMDTNEFGPRAKAWQEEYERRTNQPVDGVVSDADLRGLNIPVPAAKPIIFTVEGHMSNMFVGPAYYTAKALEDEGLVHVQPIGYDNTALPFHSQTGVDELVRLLDAQVLDDGTPFPVGTPFGICGFSEGSIVIGRTYMEHLRPTAGRVHYRLKDFKRAIAFGDPLRAKDHCAPWVPDPPKKGTQGIADVRLEDPPDFWVSHSRTGDLYSENPDNEVGLNRTSIYRIVAESKWSGSEASMWERILDLAKDPADGVVDIALAIAGGAKFVTNMSPHGAYDLGPCVDWMRGVAA